MQFSTIKNFSTIRTLAFCSREFLTYRLPHRSYNVVHINIEGNLKPSRIHVSFSIYRWAWIDLTTFRMSRRCRGIDLFSRCFAGCSKSPNSTVEFSLFPCHFYMTDALPKSHKDPGPRLMSVNPELNIRCRSLTPRSFGHSTVLESYSVLSSLPRCTHYPGNDSKDRFVPPVWIYQNSYTTQCCGRIMPP